MKSPRRLFSTWVTPLALPVAVAQRHAQDVARHVAGLAVDLGIEARILVGVGDDLGRARLEHRAGDARARRDADLAHAFAERTRENSSPASRIVEEQRRALGVEHFGDQRDHARQLVVERQLLGHRVGDFGENGEPPQRVDHALGERQIAALECRGQIAAFPDRPADYRLEDVARVPHRCPPEARRQFVSARALEAMLAGIEGAGSTEIGRRILAGIRLPAPADRWDNIGSKHARLL